MGRSKNLVLLRQRGRADKRIVERASSVCDAACRRSAAAAESPIVKDPNDASELTESGTGCGSPRFLA